MPSERLAAGFRDARDAIDLIDAWVAEAGGAHHAILDDIKLRSAIERQLLVISEAAIRIDKLDPAAALRFGPDIDWPGIRGIGNVIRHRYDDLDTQVLVDVIDGRLSALRAVCLVALAALKAG